MGYVWAIRGIYVRLEIEGIRGVVASTVIEAPIGVRLLRRG
jgi:hypothetical protein